MSDGPIDPRIALAIGAVAPDVDSALWAAALNGPMAQYGILASDGRLAMFAGQVAAETGFKTLEEDLRYTSAERLHAVWPSRFPTIEAAEPYVNNPEALANHVYAGRMGNGDEASGDGWRFRGAGLIQITGRTMFAAFGASVGRSAEDVAPSLLEPEGAALSACWYWSRSALNGLSDAWNISGVTQIINGSLDDLARRTSLCIAAAAAILPQTGTLTADQAWQDASAELQRAEPGA